MIDEWRQKRTTCERTARSAAALAAWFAFAGLLAACGGQPGQPTELRSSPASSASSSPRESGLIVFDGDSLTEGYLLAPSQSYPSQAMKQLPSWLEDVNFGVAGQTWQDLLRDVRREVDPLYSASRRLNLVVVWAGANDLAVGYSAREAFENARRYCEARRQVGLTVVTATVYPLQPKDIDAGFDARRIRYNDLLRAEGHGFADALVDLASDERIGDPSGPARRQYFIDAVHLNEAGYGVIADCVVRTLRPIVERAAR
jgi:lysophospholipase L1-like esterase